MADGEPRPEASGHPATLEPRLVAFAGALRAVGVPVAVSDDLDAVRAAAAVNLADRHEVREALAASLISSPTHRRSFELLFDIYFPTDLDAGRDGTAGEIEEGEDFIQRLLAAITAGDDAAVARLARAAVGAFGQVPNPDGSSSWFAYRVFREANPAGLLRRLLDTSAPSEDSLERRLVHDEYAARLQAFREEVEAEVRRRTAAERGPEHVARTLGRPPLEEIDFFRISAAEQAEMRRRVRQLARRLAARLAVRRRRGRDGRLDARRTMRAALATGGVPLQPAFRAKRPHRPELVLLCDLSGSVAAFAKFTLMFCHALGSQFARVRSFAFIDTVDEVTRLFDGGDFAAAITRLHAEAELVWLDGHSDYGNALETFLARYADALTPRTTVLILGDARNNYRAARAWSLAEIARQAKRVYWLNPEPRPQWDSGDSITETYVRHVDEMVECRNLRQLGAFIERIV